LVPQNPCVSAPVDGENPVSITIRDVEIAATSVLLIQWRTEHRIAVNSAVSPCETRGGLELKGENKIAASALRFSSDFLRLRVDCISYFLFPLMPILSRVGLCA
jgi:hypothetical protein